MKAVSFRPEHLDKLKPYGGFNPVWALAAERLKASENAGQVMAFTMMEGAVVHAVGGVYFLWPGVGEAFSFMGENVHKHPISLCRVFKRSLDTAFEAGGFWRIQSTVRVGFERGVRFIEYLGFSREGVMRGWSPDRADVYLYARVE